MRKPVHVGTKKNYNVKKSFKLWILVASLAPRLPPLVKILEK